MVGGRGRGRRGPPTPVLMRVQVGRAIPGQIPCKSGRKRGTPPRAGRRPAQRTVHLPAPSAAVWARSLPHPIPSPAISPPSHKSSCPSVAVVSRSPLLRRPKSLSLHVARPHCTSAAAADPVPETSWRGRGRRRRSVQIRMNARLFSRYPRNGAMGAIPGGGAETVDFGPKHISPLRFPPTSP